MNYGPVTLGDGDLANWEHSGTSPNRAKNKNTQYISMQHTQTKTHSEEYA